MGERPCAERVLKCRDPEVVACTRTAAARHQDEFGLRLVVPQVPPLRHRLVQVSDVDPVLSFLDEAFRHIGVHLAGARPVLLCLVLQRRLIRVTPVASPREAGRPCCSTSEAAAASHAASFTCELPTRSRYLRRSRSAASSAFSTFACSGVWSVSGLGRAYVTEVKMRESVR